MATSGRQIADFRPELCRCAHQDGSASEGRVAHDNAASMVTLDRPGGWP